MKKIIAILISLAFHFNQNVIAQVCNLSNFNNGITIEECTPNAALASSSITTIVYKITSTTPLPANTVIQLDYGSNGLSYVYNPANNVVGVTYPTSPSSSPQFVVSTWPASGVLILPVDIETPCNATNANFNTTTQVFINSVNYTLSTPLNLPIANFNVSLVNNPSNTPILANVGDVKEFIFRIQNNSLASALSQLRVFLGPENTIALLSYSVTAPTVNLPSLNQTYLSIPVNPPSPAFNNYTTLLNLTPADISNIGNFNSSFDANEQLDLHIIYKVLNCSNAGLGSYRFYWGGDGNQMGCQDINITTDVEVITGVPSAQATRLSLPQITNSSYCTPNSIATLGFEYKNLVPSPNVNAAPDNARMQDLKLYLSWTAEIGTVIPNSIKINGVLLSSLSAPSNFITTAGVTVNGHNFYIIDFSVLPMPITNPFAVSTNPTSISDLDNDGFLDDLSENRTFIVTADFQYVDGASNCPASFMNCSTVPKEYVILQPQLVYRNQCGALLGTSSNNDPIGSPAPNNGFLFSKGDGGSSITVPADVEAGIPFTANVCPRGSLSTLGGDFDLNCPNGEFQIKIPLPPGFYLDNTNSPNFPNVHLNQNYIPSAACNSGPLSPVPFTAVLEEVPATTPGNGYILVHLGNPPRCVAGNNYYYGFDCLNIPLKLECGVQPNPNIPNFGFNTLSFDLSYICSPNSPCETCKIKVGCASTTTFHHCNGLCDWEFATYKGFTFERKSLGYENPLSGFYDCTTITSAQPVNPTNNTSLRLNAAYPGDEVVAKAKGAFTGTGTNYSSAYFQIRYDMFASQSVFNNIIFDVLPTSHFLIEYAGNANPPINVPINLANVTVNTSAANEILWNFEIPYNLISGVTPASAASFTAEIHFKVRSNASTSTLPYNHYFSAGQHKLRNLRAEFQGIRLSSLPPPSPPRPGYPIEPSCDHWGANFDILQPVIMTRMQTLNTATANCSQYQMAVDLTVIPALRSALNQEDFPNEFRPYSVINQNFVINVPQGYNVVNVEYTAAKHSYNLNSNTSNFGNNQSVFTIPLNYSYNNITQQVTVNGTSAGCFPITDVVYFPNDNSLQQIVLTLQPLCNAAATSFFNLQGSCTENPFSPGYENNVVVPQSLPNYQINFSGPQLSVVSPPAVSMLNTTVQFPFIICNTSGPNQPSSAPNTWVSIQSPNGALVPQQIIAASNPLNPIPLTFSSGYYWAYLGNIPANSCNNFILTAQSTPAACVSGNAPITDFINVNYGSYCANPPAVPLPVLSSACSVDATVFNFIRYPAALNLLVPNGMPNSPIQVCNSSVTYHFQIENPSQSNLNNPVFWVDLPQNVTINNATFTYPINSTNTYNAAPSVGYGSNSTGSGWALEAVIPSLSPNGLPGFNASNNLNLIGVDLTVDYPCNAAPQQPIGFFTEGVSPCLNNLTASTQHLPNFDLSEFEPVDVNYYATQLNLNCSNFTTVIIKLTNPNLNSSANGVYEVVVPLGFTFSNFSVPPTAVLPQQNGSTILQWSNIAIPPNTQLVLTFQLAITSNTLYSANNLTLPGSFNYSHVTNCNNQTCTFAATAINAVINYAANCCPAINVQSTNPSCSGSSNGSIVLSNSYISQYSFVWTPNVSQSNVANNLSAGIYNIVASSSSNGYCNQQISVTLTSPFALTTNNIIVPTCNTLCNGSAVVNPSGGTPPYTYAWSHNATLTGNTATNLCAGSYNCTITDSRGCSIVSTIVITNAPPLNLNVVTTNVLCPGLCTGAANFVVSGGNAPYTYNWSGFGNPSGTGSSATGLCSGLYQVSVLDARGCSINQNFQITQPLPLVANNVIIPACNNLCNGSAVVNMSGGTAPYTYAWSHNTTLTGNTATNLCAGSYNCTITDSRGCSIVSTIVITNALPLTLNVVTTNIPCHGLCTGAANFIVSGGITPYTYNWNAFGNPSGTGSSATGLCAGLYQVTVSDARGCSVNQNFQITQPSALSANLIQTNGSCNAGANLSMNVSGGVPPYTYVWSPNVSSASTANNVAAGNYNCTVTDSRGCQITRSILARTSNLSLTANNCRVIYIGLSNSTVLNANVSNAQGPVTYLWTPGNVTTTNLTVTTPLATTPITRNLTVTDGSGCSRSETFTIYSTDIRCGIGLTRVKVCQNGVVNCLTVAQANTYINALPNGPTPTNHYGECSYDNPCTSAYRLINTDNANQEQETETTQFLSVIPNPFIENTLIKFKVKKTANVALKLFDYTGKFIKTCYENKADATQVYEHDLSMDNLPAGMYLLKLESNETINNQSAKLILQR